MNQRIRELAEQANLTIATSPLWEHKVQEFAQLIVAECISVVDDAERGGSNEIWDNAVKFIRKDIKQHFGVEP